MYWCQSRNKTSVNCISTACITASKKLLMNSVKLCWTEHPITDTMSNRLKEEKVKNIHLDARWSAGRDCKNFVKAVGSGKKYQQQQQSYSPSAEMWYPPKKRTQNKKTNNNKYHLPHPTKCLHFFLVSREIRFCTETQLTIRLASSKKKGRAWKMSFMECRFVVFLFLSYLVRPVDYIEQILGNAQIVNSLSNAE